MRRVERFKVRGDDGSEHLVECWQDEIVSPTTDGVTTIPGLKQFRLANGEPINQVDERTFQMVIGGKVLRRADDHSDEA